MSCAWEFSVKLKYISIQWIITKLNTALLQKIYSFLGSSKWTFIPFLSKTHRFIDSMCRCLKSNTFLTAPHYEYLLSSFSAEHLPTCRLSPASPVSRPKPSSITLLALSSSCAQIYTSPAQDRTTLNTPVRPLPAQHPTVVFSWTSWAPKPPLVCCCCCCWIPFPRMLSPAYFLLSFPVYIWVFFFWQKASQRQLSFTLRSWKSLLQHKN